MAQILYSYEEMITMHADLMAQHVELGHNIYEGNYPRVADIARSMAALADRMEP